MTVIKRWLGPVPTHCDICKLPLAGHFVDGATTFSGVWGIMCMKCFGTHGFGLGIGKGQKYELPSGNKVQG